MLTGRTPFKAREWRSLRNALSPASTYRLVGAGTEADGVT